MHFSDRFQTLLFSPFISFCSFNIIPRQKRTKTESNAIIIQPIDGKQVLLTRFLFSINALPSKGKIHKK